jgi:hypothetical protein
MTIFGIVVAVMMLGFVVWIMSMGGRGWSGGWRGATPNVVGIVILLVIVLGSVTVILTR